MQAVVLSDVHFHDFPQGPRLKWSIKAFWLVCGYAHKHGINTVLFCGDLFHKQKAVPTKVVLEALRLFDRIEERFPDLEIYGISGNHDDAETNLYDRPAEVATEIVRKYTNKFKLLDRDRVDINDVLVHGIPYYEHTEDFHEALEEVRRAKEELRDKAHILLMHQTPDKATGAGFMGPDVKVSEFGDFDLVLNGHIHMLEQLADNFFDVGATHQQHKGESGVQMGFWVMDMDRGISMKFHPMGHKLPEFVRYRAGEDPGDVKDNDILVEVPNVSGDQKEEGEPAEEFAELKAEEMVDDFVEKMKDHKSIQDLDPDVLRNIGKELIRDADRA